MGLIHSFSRLNLRAQASTSQATNTSMSSGGQEERPTEDSSVSDDESAFTSMLLRLIRSGQVRLITTDNAATGVATPRERDDEISDEDTRAWHRAPVAQAVDDYLPDTKSVDESDLKVALGLASGSTCRGRRVCAKNRSLPRPLHERESGQLKNEEFSLGEKANIFNRFLPNRMETIAKHRSKVFCGQYIQDGRMFVSACQDQKIRFFAVTGQSGCKRKNQFKLQTSVDARDVGWSVLDVAVSPDGRHAVYSSWSEYLHQCSVVGDNENQAVLHLRPTEQRFCVFSLRFSSDGREILAGASDRSMYIYDREQNERTLRIEGHEDDVNAVAFADDSSHILYSGGDDGLIKVWDRRTLNEAHCVPVGTLAGHMDGITFIDSRGDARYLISNSKDQSIKLWDIRKFSNNQALEAARQAVAEQHWDYRWQSVPRKALRNCRKLDGDSSLLTCRGHLVLHTLVRCFFSPSFSTGQRYIYSGCATGRLLIYDALTGKIEKKLPGHYACVRDVSWHPFNMDICTSSWDGTIGQWYYDGRIGSGDCTGTEDPSDDESPASDQPQRSIAGRLRARRADLSRRSLNV